MQAHTARLATVIVCECIPLAVIVAAVVGIIWQAYWS